eukprot:4530539-Alexandrium_andersonii.AAC.1
MGLAHLEVPVGWVRGGGSRMYGGCGGGGSPREGVGNCRTMMEGVRNSWICLLYTSPSPRD